MQRLIAISMEIINVTGKQLVIFEFAKSGISSLSLAGKISGCKQSSMQSSFQADQAVIRQFANRLDFLTASDFSISIRHN